MASTTLVKYYLLCSVENGKTPSMLNSLSSTQLGLLLTKKEQDVFIKSLNGRIVANETVIGGDDSEVAITSPKQPQLCKQITIIC